MTEAGRPRSHGRHGTFGFVDLTCFLADAHEDLVMRLRGAVVRKVPEDRWHEQADGGGSSIAWLLLHVARHHDLALTTAIKGQPPLFASHAAALGLAGADAASGLPEKEDLAVSSGLAPVPLLAYLDVVFAASERWIRDGGAASLDGVSDVAGRLEHEAGIDPQRFDWLYGMWSGKSIGWFVQWPIIGHGHSHVGEAISVRNRMGLSPF